MRLIVWNMAAGYGYGAAEHETAWRYLEELDPDIALLQEAVPPAWAFERWAGLVAAPKYRGTVPWGSAILCRDCTLEPLATSDRTYWLRELWGGTVVARAPGLGGLWLVSIHSKAESRCPSEFPVARMRDVVMCATGKVWEIERAAADLGPLLAGSRFVAGGDLNSSLRFDRVYRRDANRKLFANLDRAGLKDLRLPFSAEEHRTYFKKGRGPYQLDHVFADAETRDATRGWRVLAEASSGLWA